jgi:hypothetical protein
MIPAPTIIDGPYAKHNYNLTLIAFRKAVHPVNFTQKEKQYRRFVEERKRFEKKKQTEKLVYENGKFLEHLQNVTSEVAPVIHHEIKKPIVFRNHRPS